MEMRRPDDESNVPKLFKPFRIDFEDFREETFAAEPLIESDTLELSIGQEEESEGNVGNIGIVHINKLDRMEKIEARYRGLLGPNIGSVHMSKYAEQNAEEDSDTLDLTQEPETDMPEIQVEYIKPKKDGEQESVWKILE